MTPLDTPLDIAKVESYIPTSEGYLAQHGPSFLGGGSALDTSFGVQETS
jgi:hypothetical protein